MQERFIKAEDFLFPLSAITEVNLSGMETGYVDVVLKDGRIARAHDFDAFEIVMGLHPSALEGRRLRWVKNAWALHNLVAHPLMQILVWCGLKKAGLWLHDVTVPKPTGLRSTQGLIERGGQVVDRL